MSAARGSGIPTEMSLVSWLREMEQKAVDAEIESLGIEVPPAYRKMFARISGAAEYTYILERLVQERFGDNQSLKCLVVGLFGGRDYFFLKSRGHDVDGLDLEPVDGIPEAKTGNAEEPWPFESDQYDLVVMGEILEHLHHDMAALAEARRVLKPNGQLIATVPFLDSNDSYHVRIHDPLSFQRLLEMNYFKVEHALERPGMTNMGNMNYLVATAAAAARVATGRNIYGPVTRWFGALEWRLGHMRLPRRLLKTLGVLNWGGIYSCSVSEEAFDYVRHNIEEFASSNTSRT